MVGTGGLGVEGLGAGPAGAAAQTVDLATFDTSADFDIALTVTGPVTLDTFDAGPDYDVLQVVLADPPLTADIDLAVTIAARLTSPPNASDPPTDVTERQLKTVSQAWPLPAILRGRPYDLGDRQVATVATFDAGADFDVLCVQPPATDFTTLGVSNLFIWLTADGLPLGALSSWPGSSGNGRTPTQGTGSRQPTVTTSPIAGKECYPCVDFDGSSDVMAWSTNFFNADTDEMTAFAVVDVDDQGPFDDDGAIMSNRRDDSLAKGWEWLIRDVAGGQVDFLYQVLDAGAASAVVSTADFAQQTLVAGWVRRASTESYDTGLNDNTVDSSSSGEYGASSRTQTWLGASSGDAAFPSGSDKRLFNGRLYELVVYDRELSDAEVQTVLDHLNARYGFV